MALNLSQNSHLQNISTFINFCLSTQCLMAFAVELHIFGRIFFDDYSVSKLGGVNKYAKVSPLLEPKLLPLNTADNLSISRLTVWSTMLV